MEKSKNKTELSSITEDRSRISGKSTPDYKIFLAVSIPLNDIYSLPKNLVFDLFDFHHFVRDGVGYAKKKKTWTKR